VIWKGKDRRRKRGKETEEKKQGKRNRRKETGEKKQKKGIEE